MKKSILLFIFLVACDLENHSQQPEIQKSREAQSQEVKNNLITTKADQTALEENYTKLVFSDFHDACWHIVQLKMGVKLKSVSSPAITCFENFNEADVSPNEKISLLHALQRGVLEDGTKVTRVERYACYFIDFRTGVLSDAYTGGFCGGEWGRDSNWVVSEKEHYSISELF